MSDFFYLRDVETFRVPSPILARTRDALRAWGRRGLEARALWVGQPQGRREFDITDVWIPRQHNTLVSTHVNGDELERIFERVHALGVTLAAQVHTHPADAFHSPTDDESPITTQVGSLSIVIPNFAREPLDNLEHCATYRLHDDGWRLVDEKELARLIHTTEADP